MFRAVKLLLGLSRDATTIWRSSLFAVRLVALVMASVAFSGVLFITEPAGPGLEPASASYLGAAESLASGHGFRVPTAPWNSADSTSSLTHYPSGFSMAIAGPTALGLPAAQAARLVEALSAFIAMAALLAIVGDAAGAGAATLLGLALLVMPATVDLHLSVVSGPLFLACMAFTLATMVAAPDQPLAAGLSAAAALLVRFSGVAAVVAAVLWALTRRGAPRDRARRAVVAAAPALLLLLAWLVATHGAGARAARRLGVYGDWERSISGGARTLTMWLAPTAHAVPGAGWVALLVAAGVAAMLVVGTRRAYRLWRLLPADIPLHSSTNVPQLIAARVLGASALLGGCYALAVLAARLFADGGLTFDGRLLAPLIVLVAVAFSVAAATWWRSVRRAARAGLLVALAAWGGGSLAASWRHAHDALEHGADLANDAWRESLILDWARTDGGSHPLYSNWPAVSYLYLGRPARGLPPSADPQTLRAFGDTLSAHGGVVLAFLAPNPAYVSPDSLASALGLRVVATFPDGRVLGPAPR